MISALLVATLVAASPELGTGIREVRRAFIEDGEDLVSATATHRVVSHPDGSLEVRGTQSLRFSLESVRRDRGAPCLTTSLGRERVSPRAVRTRRACALEETWTNQPDGLEQAFTLQRAPAGTGGLRLRLVVEGPWHHQDAAGHLFGGPGADQLRYGHAFVLRGARRLIIPVVRVEGGLELRVPRELLDAPGAFPMIIDPLLTPEFPLDPELSLGLLSSQEAEPAVAVDDTGRALVAWTDDRRQVQTDIFAARFDRNGLLDPTGLPVTTEPGHQRHPAVAWTGAAFVVAWEQELVDGGQVRARTISPSGALTEPVDLAPGTQPVLAGVPDGGYAVLAWVDTSQVRAARLVGPSTLLAYAAASLSNGAARPTRPAVAASGANAFVTWEQPGALAGGASSIRGAWLGATVSPSLLLSPADGGEAHRPTVALVTGTGEEDALVYWEEAPSSVGGCLLSGSQLEPLLSFPGRDPAVVRTSSAVGLAGATLGSISALGAVTLKDLAQGTSVSFSVLGTHYSELALASDNSLVMGVWTQGQAATDVVGAAVTLPIGNNNLSFVPLSTAASQQLHPHVALQGSEGLAAWMVDGTGIVGARVTLGSDGPTTGSRFELVSRLQRIEQFDLAAGPPGRYLLIWRQADLLGSAVFAQQADHSGPVGAVIPLSSTAIAGPTVAWDALNGAFVVAWVNQPLLGSREVVSTTISEAGVAVLPPGTRGTDQASDVDVTCLATGKCLLAWDARLLRQVNTMVLGANNPVPVSIANAGEPAVTNDGRDFFVGWRAASALSFARVDPTSGQVTLLPLVVSASTGSVLSQLSLAPGAPPVAAWSEVSADVTKVKMLQFGFPPTLVAAGGQAPIIATNDLATRGVVVYQRYDGTQERRATRAYGAGFSLPVDAGVDAGAPADVDAGVPADVDAGAPDAGEAPDGGVMSFGTTGCGCQGAGPVAPLLLLAFVLLRRRPR